MYRSGEVAKILDIHVETLRYFESIGIVQPKKNKRNNYRYYDDWDIYFLLDYKRYRSFEFSAEESRSLCHDDDLPMFQAQFEEKHREIQRKALQYTILSETMEQKLEKIKHIHDHLGKLTFRKSQEFYCLIYSNTELLKPHSSIKEVYEEILDFYPFFENIIHFRKEAILSYSAEPYRLGLTITREIADRINFNHIDEKLTRIPSQDCFYTIIPAGDRGTLTHHLLDDSLKAIEKSGYTLNGDVYGNLIARVHEGNDYYRYLEFLIPVTKKSQ